MANLDVLLAMQSRTLPVQLVKHYADVAAKDKVFPMFGEVKYDGVYCAMLVDSTGIICVSRTAKPYYKKLNLLAQNAVGVLPEGVYICEVVNSELSLEELSGMVNPNRVKDWTTEESAVMHQHTELKFHDVLTHQEMIDGISHRRFWDRRRELVDSAIPKHMLTECCILHSQADLDALAREIIEDRNGEGIVVKDLDAGWLAGAKGYRAMKVVRGINLDLRCVGAVISENGKRKGQIGKLTFEYGGKRFNADLGKGWTDDRRIALTTALVENSEDSPVGKIYRVSGLQISSKGVVRLPKVNELRIDKDIPDEWSGETSENE